MYAGGFFSVAYVTCSWYSALAKIHADVCCQNCKIGPFSSAATRKLCLAVAYSESLLLLMTVGQTLCARDHLVHSPPVIVLQLRALCMFVYDSDTNSVKALSKHPTRLSGAFLCFVA